MRSIFNDTQCGLLPSHLRARAQRTPATCEESRNFPLAQIVSLGP